MPGQDNPVLKRLAALDSAVSKTIYKMVPKRPSKQGEQIHSILKLLEWSCHGVPWLGGLAAAIYLFPESKALPLLLVGMVIDLVYVAVIKAAARRCRPVYANQVDQMILVSLDKHSFPSGHSSRAIYVALFVHFGDPFSIFSLLVWIWALAVCVSRIALGRHYLGDVLAGTALGIFESWFQFSPIGLPISNALIWTAGQILGMQFNTKNDDGAEVSGDEL